MTITKRFLKFMVEHHEKELTEFLNNYSESNATLTVDFQSLKWYDNELANLITEMPNLMMDALNKAVTSSEMIPDDAIIYFKFLNFDNVVDLKDISSKHIGHLIRFDAYIETVADPHPSITEAVFECRACMNLQIIEQLNRNKITTPSICHECGGRSFRIDKDSSKYIDEQKLVVGSWDTNQKLIVILSGDLCSYDDYPKNSHIQVTGILDTFNDTGSKHFEKYLRATGIEILPRDEDFEDVVEDVADSRNNPEYKAWVDKVIRDSGGVCACCGGEKHLHAHHVFSYADYPDLRLDLNNGIALCKWCHGKYNSYYGAKGTAKNLIEFLNKFGNSTKEIIYVERTRDENPEEPVQISENENIEEDKEDFVNDLFIERVRFLEEKYGGMCPVDALAEDYGVMGVSSEDMENLIKSNTQRGNIYYPVKGYVKVLDDNL